ncbi:MAG: hypothetical protein AB7G25_09140 [Sphingomonadaceae bacterium]
MSGSDAIADFIGAMEAAGIAPAEPIIQELSAGGIVRFDVHGDRKGRKNGWAVFHADGIPAGAFGSYKHGVSAKWRANVERRQFTAAERAEYRLKIKRQKAEQGRQRAELHAVTAERAASLWASSADPDPAHPYLIKKRISGEGMRQSGNMLLIPMRDIDGKLWNVQRIYPDGTKLYLKGGRCDGLMWLVGDPDAATCIGEGAGTMAAVRRATGHAIAAAFTYGNLERVALSIAVRWPDCDLIICADDDAHLVDHPTIQRNIGLEAAHAAAVAVGGRVAVPEREASNA